MEKDSEILLEKLRGRNAFRVPDGYFSDFTDKMMNLLPENEITMAPKISIFSRVRPWLCAAAAVIGVVLLFNVLKNNDDTTVNNNNSGAVISAAPESDEDVDFLEYIEEMYADAYAVSYIEDLM